MLSSRMVNPSSAAGWNGDAVFMGVVEVAAGIGLPVGISKEVALTFGTKIPPRSVSGRGEAWLGSVSKMAR